MHASLISFPLVLAAGWAIERFAAAISGLAEQHQSKPRAAAGATTDANCTMCSAGTYSSMSGV